MCNQLEADNNFWCSCSCPSVAGGPRPSASAEYGDLSMGGGLMSSQDILALIESMNMGWIGLEQLRSTNAAYLQVSCFNHGGTMHGYHMEGLSVLGT